MADRLHPQEKRAASLPSLSLVTGPERRLTVRLSLQGGVFVVALSAGLVTWALFPPRPLPFGDELLLLALMTAVIASQRFPLRLGQGMRLSLASVPLYLLAALFAPPLAAIAAGGAMLLRELLICRRCGNEVGQIAAQVGRWMLLILGASALLHLWAAPELLYGGVPAALLLWLGDVCTAPLVLPSWIGGNLVGTLGMVAQRSYAGELSQYLVAYMSLVLIQASSAELRMFYAPAIAITLVLLYRCLESMNAEPRADPSPAHADSE